MAIHYQFIKGRNASDLSLVQLQEERDVFVAWSLKQDALPNTNKHVFKNAFSTLIASKSKDTTPTVEAQAAAVALLEKGLSFSPIKQAYNTRNYGAPKRS